jgi:hypothetical protein
LTQIFIVSGTSWTVPADWNPADNSIETIGGGGGGGTSSGGNDAGGGGGGAYSKITNLTLSPGSVTLQVGSGGGPNTNGGDTYFNGASLGASSVGAQGGRGASEVTGGAGGASGSGVGSTKYSGGDGGTSNNAGNGGAGGGGAAGPGGAGQAGGPSVTHNAGSAGGGAGGANSTAGVDSSGSTGGHGGAAQDGTAGGAGGVDGVSDAAAGSHGSGGGGGASGSHVAGAAGGDGVEFDPTHGAGGGGGAGGYALNSNQNGGTGGLYGGGGGGTAFAPGTGIGGPGAQGIIVITYTPVAGNRVTADAWTSLESSGTAFKDDLEAVQFLGLTAHHLSLPVAALRGVRYDVVHSIEPNGFTSSNTIARAEFASSPNVSACIPIRFEFNKVVPSRTVGSTGFTAGILRNTDDALEWLEFRRGDLQGAVEHLTAVEVAPGLVCDLTGRALFSARLDVEAVRALEGNANPPIESLAALSNDRPSLLETVSGGIRISTTGLFLLEWADPPGLLLVSSERLLRSPGRIRILASPCSKHPLRGQ